MVKRGGVGSAWDSFSVLSLFIRRHVHDGYAVTRSPDITSSNDSERNAICSAIFAICGAVQCYWRQMFDRADLSAFRRLSCCCGTACLRCSLIMGSIPASWWWLQFPKTESSTERQEHQTGVVIVACSNQANRAESGFPLFVVMNFTRYSPVFLDHHLTDRALS